MIMEYCELIIFIIGIVYLPASLCVPLADKENSTQTLDEKDVSAFLQRLQLLSNNMSSGLPGDVQETALNSPAPSLAETNFTTSSAPEERDFLEFIEKLNKALSNFHPQDNKQSNASLGESQNSTQETEPVYSTTQNANDVADSKDILAFIDKLNKLNNESSQRDENKFENDEYKFENAADDASTAQSSTQESVTSVGDKSRISLTKVIVRTDDSLIIALTALAVFLVLVLATAFVWVFLRKCRSRRRQKMMLNKDCNRWDPQLLRPSQKSINDFIFGMPIPSVSEMIKQ